MSFVLQKNFYQFQIAIGLLTFEIEEVIELYILQLYCIQTKKL